jgi:hypothetical protein
VTNLDTCDGTIGFDEAPPCRAATLYWGYAELGLCGIEDCADALAALECVAGTASMRSRFRFGFEPEAQLSIQRQETTNMSYVGKAPSLTLRNLNCREMLL